MYTKFYINLLLGNYITKQPNLQRNVADIVRLFYGSIIKVHQLFSLRFPRENNVCAVPIKESVIEHTPPFFFLMLAKVRCGKVTRSFPSRKTEKKGESLVYM